MADLTKATLNAQGQVAMRYMQQKPALVKCNGTQYYFSTKASISMAFVNPEDVDCLLAVMEGCGCAGGRKKNMIFLADETHARRWINGGGR